MLVRWFFSQHHTCPDLGHRFPICRAYGNEWHVPLHPEAEDGWALVQMLCDPHQIEAAKQDHRIVYLSPTGQLPKAVIDAYEKFGAKPQMDLATLLTVLSEHEPRFAIELK